MPTQLKKRRGTTNGRHNITVLSKRRGNGKGGSSLLTRTSKQIVYNALEIGMPFNRACCLAGISNRQATKIRKAGENKRTRILYDFYLRCLRVEARREYEALNVIRKAAKGGEKYRETKIKSIPIGEDGQNYKIETTTTTKELHPQWNAAAWYLERRNRQDFGKDYQQEQKTPQEVAAEIHSASLQIFQSVPLIPAQE